MISLNIGTSRAMRLRNTSGPSATTGGPILSYFSLVSGLARMTVTPAVLQTDRQAWRRRRRRGWAWGRRRGSRANGYPPTLREIGEHLGIRSTNGVGDHLKALERKGYLVREELKSRALRPVDAPGAPRSVRFRRTSRSSAARPRVGRSSADENVTKRISVDQFFLHGNQPREVFGLVVYGESMIEDGIFDGDYVFVRRQATHRAGRDRRGHDRGRGDGASVTTPRATRSACSPATRPCSRSASTAAIIAPSSWSAR